jgi:hypothetical protein
VPLVAVGIVAMLGALAMVIDTGMFTIIQGQFKAAADAAALAGAYYPPVCIESPAPPAIPGDPIPYNGCASDLSITAPQEQAVEVARRMAQANGNAVSGLCDDTINVTVLRGQPPTELRQPANVNWIVVTVSCEAKYTFGRILNLSSKHVEATSAAALGVRDVNGDITDYKALNDLNCTDPNWLRTNPPCIIARLVQ